MTILTIIVLLGILLMGAHLYIRRTPAGMVEFRSGLVLKFLPSLDHMEPIDLRASLEKFAAKNAHKVKVPIKEVKDLTISTRHGDIKGRLYNDAHQAMDRCIVFYHGGGFCIGSIDTHNEQARRVAKATGLPLLSVDYSLSPEAKFPHAVDECIDTVLWAKDQLSALGINKPQYIPMGDSAGGNLAIVVANELIKMGHRDLITQVVPIYPVTDSTKEYESNKLYGEGYYLTSKAMANFMRDYMSSPEDINDVRASPILETDLSQFPPSFILTAGFDPLRDQGEAFAEKLKAAGCDVKLKRYDNALHAFFGLKDFGKKGLDAVDDVAKFLVG